MTAPFNFSKRARREAADAAKVVRTKKSSGELDAQYAAASPVDRGPIKHAIVKQVAKEDETMKILEK